MVLRLRSIPPELRIIFINSVVVWRISVALSSAIKSLKCCAVMPSKPPEDERLNLSVIERTRGLVAFGVSVLHSSGNGIYW